MQTNPCSIHTDMLFLMAWTGANTANAQWQNRSAFDEWPAKQKFPVSLRALQVCIALETLPVQHMLSSKNIDFE